MNDNRSLTKQAEALQRFEAEPGLGDATRQAIGRTLREKFANTVAAELPADFLALLDAFEQRERNSQH